MDTKLAAICGRILPLLEVMHQEKHWYLENILKKNEPTEKNLFLIEKTSSHINELAYLGCAIGTLLFPECEAKQATESDLELLNFLNSNELLKAKVIEKMNGATK